ncbi:hypothetical protein EV401DRAFT_1999686, partial [Pisolithus croceorrhizus]
MLPCFDKVTRDLWDLHTWFLNKKKNTMKQLAPPCYMPVLTNVSILIQRVFKFLVYLVSDYFKTSLLLYTLSPTTVKTCVFIAVPFLKSSQIFLLLC